MASKTIYFPFSMTMMRSASCTLEIRCAMISFVVSGISVRNAFRIFASVAVSTALVLSVQNQHLWFLQQCSRDTEALFLTAGYVGSALLDVGVIRPPASDR